MLQYRNIYKLINNQMLPIINIEIIEASHNYRYFYTKIVQECIKERKSLNHTIKYVDDQLAVTRQRLSNFENLKIHYMALANNYLELYFKEINFSVVQHKK